jgi:DNA-binding transcriptional MerR regulator
MSETNPNNLFAEATRRKLRFPTIRGEVDVERLWEMHLTGHGGFNLDEVAKAIDATRTATAKSFVHKAKPSPEHVAAEMKLQVVEHIIKVKLEEAEAAEKKQANQARKQKLLEALEKKQDGELSAKSIEDLRKEIDALDT